MRYIGIVLLLCVLCLTGCDSDSESNLNDRFFPDSNLGATTTLDVPGMYQTIQAAIDAAGPGDFVRVAAGGYQENLQIRGKQFGLRGAGKGQTIIHGSITITDSPEVSLEGVSVTTGNGIHARRSTVKIIGNEILNHAGPGLWLEDCTLVTISDNQINNNGREGILVDSSQGIIGSNGVMGNMADGIVINNSSPGLTGNQVIGNKRDGIAIRGFTYNASPHLLENTSRDNGGVSNYDIICFGGNTNPTGNGNVFGDCMNCGECRSFDDPVTYFDTSKPGF